jgi:hypothetical protein
MEQIPPTAVIQQPTWPQHMKSVQMQIHYSVCTVTQPTSATVTVHRMLWVSHPYWTPGARCSLHISLAHGERHISSSHFDERQVMNILISPRTEAEKCWVVLSHLKDKKIAQYTHSALQVMHVMFFPCQRLGCFTSYECQWHSVTT